MPMHYLYVEMCDLMQIYLRYTPEGCQPLKKFLIIIVLNQIIRPGLVDSIVQFAIAFTIKLLKTKTRNIKYIISFVKLLYIL